MNKFNKPELKDVRLHLLNSYYNDLKFIEIFQECKYKKISEKEYFDSTEFSFKRFLKDWGIIKNISREQQIHLQKLIFKWVRKDKENNVDLLVQNLIEQGVTNNRLLSLCSKFLFLNKPDKVFPYDSHVRKAIGYNGKIYSDYYMKINTARQDLLSQFGSEIIFVEKKLKRIESFFSFKSLNVIEIRKNRIIDKLLWIKGSKKYYLKLIIN
ncbi:MAG TPA: hypothetical protein VK588_06565 [Chitinophagaceae bacterium]|nr:hypothetical protein [Chitinophagaceae bacterium]